MKNLFSLLPIGCICLMMHISSVFALDAPDCGAGTCQDAAWDSELNMYSNCNEGGGLDATGDPLTCSCYDTNELKWQYYDCTCSGDEECSRGDNMGYCDVGKCKSCIDDGNDCTGSTTTQLDDCNYQIETMSWTCRDGCTTSTTFGCYTNGTDGLGDYTCN